MRGPVAAIAAMLIVGTFFLATVASGQDVVKPMGPAGPAGGKGCISCHADLSAVLKKGHPKVEGAFIETCIACHKPAARNLPVANRFSSRMHRPHVNGSLQTGCMTCHSRAPYGGFGLRAPGTDIVLGIITESDLPLLGGVFVSWADSPYLDAAHGRANVTCAACHGTKIPAGEASAESSRCIACHGRYECLAEKTAQKDFPERNPHSSHLGQPACTDCHRGHKASRVLCLDCHRDFSMKVPGQAVRLREDRRK